MSFGHCSCPDCGTTLRIRDRSFVGRVVPCPECRVALIIELDRDESLSARKQPLNTQHRCPPDTAIGVAAAPQQATRRRVWLSQLQRAAGSPLIMAWALGLAVTALFVVTMLRPTHRFQSPSRPTRPDEPNINSIPLGQPTPDADSHQSPNVELFDSPVADAIEPANAPALPAASPSPLLPVEDGSNIKPVTTVSVKPADPPSPAPPVRIDFEVTLKQPLLLFDQSKPVSRRELIELMEELIGAPIHYDAIELGQQNLDKPVTFKMENTTLAGVLKSILDPAGWMFVTEETQLRVKLKPPQLH